MINISFDNPYLLLLLIPLVLIVVIPFAIAIRRENSSRETTLALISHLLIAVLAVLAVAGMINTTFVSKTEVYVLADLSHSTAERLEQMEGYIKDLGEQLPPNSEMGVIAFGKDAILHTKPGAEFTTLQNSGVDESATDILAALNYASSLFRENTLKHLVLYTDGLSTNPDANGQLANLVESLFARGIDLDVVYIDSNVGADAKEIQISDVTVNPSTYLGHENTADILIESSMEIGAIIRLTKNGAPYLEKTANLTVGYNMINFDLATDEEGEFDYEVSVTTQNDGTALNNRFLFTQKVREKISVLLVTDREENVEAVKAMYGENAEISAYVKPVGESTGNWNDDKKPVVFDVPFTVEDLCSYDEYILCNVDISGVNNADSFVQSIDLCVSLFGKSLITAGDNNLQTNDAEEAEALNNMLPVKFGNNDSDPKLYAIVIDASRSMEYQNFDWFKMAKSAGKYLLDFLNETDYFTLVYFSGEVYVPMPPCQATYENITEAKSIIDGLTVTQGTMIDRALDRVGEMLAGYSFEDKQVMLISDGMTFEGGEAMPGDPLVSAQNLRNNGIIVSALNVGNSKGVDTMQKIAAFGGGNYYFSKSSADLVDVMFEEIADDVTDTVILGTTQVEINRPADPVLDGLDAIPAIEGYVYAKAKASAENILYVDYQKAGGSTVKAPLYAYWSYGNGRVATLTTDLVGEWVPNWSGEAGTTFLQNIKTTNVPNQRIDYPYTVEVGFDGKSLHVELVPVVLNPDATMTVTLTLPDGSQTEKKLTFDSYRYFHEFEVDQIGKYTLDARYDFSNKSYLSSTVYSISYSPEYDAFQSYSPAAIHGFMRDSGSVTEEGNVDFEVDRTRMDTYVISFTVPFFAIAAVLYLIDTVIRKLKWADIKSFFKRQRKEAAK